MKAAIYVRVSTEEQANSGTGLTEQLDGARLLAELRGWEVVAEYADEGISGTLDSRPQLDSLMRAAEAGEFEVVIIHRLSRLARKASVALRVCDQLAAAGVDLASVKEQIDTSTPTGKFMRTMLAAVAELDRDSIVETMSAGQRQRVSAGKWPGGPAPFGFALEKADAGTVVVIAEAEAESIRTAARMIADEGMSTWQVVDQLEAMGHKPRNAERWQPQNLRRVLTDERCAGRWVYKSRRGELEMALPVIIEPDLWKRLQRRLAEKSPSYKRPTRYYLLSRGILRAPCGGLFHGVSRYERGSHHYRCANSLPLAKERCDCKRIKADDFDAMIRDYVENLLWDPDRILALADDYLGMADTPEDDTEDRLAKVRGEIDRTGKALGRASATLLKAGADAATIEGANLELADELARLRAVEAHLVDRLEDNDRVKVRAQTIEELASVARKELWRLSMPEFRQILDLCELRIDVHGWVPCKVCDGKGKLKGGDRYEGGTICPGCRTMRWTPQVTVSGTFTERVLDAEVWHADDGVPRSSRCCSP